MTSGSTQRVSAVLASLAVLIISLATVMPYALYRGLLQCDELCDSESGWRADQGAWQWKAQLIVALVGIVASIIAVRGAWRNGWRGVRFAGMVAIPSYITWAVLVLG